MPQKYPFTTWSIMAQNWEKHITRPGRPCLSQLQIWRQAIKENIKNPKEAKALILGATPELRDLVLDLGMESVTIDINKNMMKAMSELVKNKNRSKEKRIVKNWFEIEFKDNSFDLVLGDAALGQVSNKAKMEKLLKKIVKALKSEGLLLIREMSRDKKQPLIKTKEEALKLFYDWQDKKIDSVNLYLFLKYQSYLNPYPQSPSFMDIVILGNNIKKLGKEYELANLFYNWMHEVFGSSKPLLLFLKKDLEKLLGKYFKILPLKQCADYKFCKYMPSYLGRPKK